jgi:CBS domain-containing protein
VAERDFFTTEPGAPLDEVFQQMNAENRSTVPVVEGEQLVGLLTLENVGELIMVSSALKSQPRSGRPPGRLSGKSLQERPGETPSSPGSTAVP